MKLSVEQAATRLGISKYTLRTWLRQRRLAYFRLGRRVVLDERDVERYVGENRVESREAATR